MKFNCLIVDDEPIAREIIKTYCAHLPYLTILASVGNALEAKTFLLQEKVDILFLDINMPVMDGVTFLKTLRNPPQVIFTTAYKEYALDAFELSACDYLLKPFSMERFIVAVDKAVERLSVPQIATVKNPEVPVENFLFIKTEGKIVKILHQDLLYVEASGNYTKLVTGQATWLPAMTFSSVEELLPKSSFLRIHRSFIINKSKIDHIEGNRLFVRKIEIPISTTYRESLLRDLGLEF